MGDQGLRRPRRAGSDDGGWSHVAMRWLTRLTQPVEITLCWAVGVLAGGVILGWLPAGVAAGAVLSRLGTPEASAAPVTDFFRSWRRHLWRANAVGWPATVALLIMAVNIWVLSRGGEPWMPVVLGLTLLLAAWLVLATGYLMALLERPALSGAPASSLWRLALAMPALSPGTSAAWVVTVAALLVVAVAVPPVGLLFGPGAFAWVTGWLTRRGLESARVVGSEG
ncbi:DUF624 domain-containing protein [Tessaracoccus sp. O5.2]|uniref:DUF624 domain-containing protein n=1 Tax=Tessaracoccus sp. O5.2 TaxID=3157622 RepID=UPI0036DAC689